MSGAISDGKHVVTFANTSKRRRVCLFSQKDWTILALQNAQFRQVLSQYCFL